MSQLTIFVNRKVVYEYDKDVPLQANKLAFLDTMDRDMSRGIRIRGQLIAQPDQQQRANFMALNLIKALQQDNQAVAQASCAYLAQRLPALTEVHVDDGSDGLEIELVQ